MIKRKLFDELKSVINEASQYEREQDKITLRTYKIDKKPLADITPNMIRDIRNKIHLSQAVFAYRLRVSPRTVENWEQGRAKPSKQAAALILMAKKYPDTLDRLATL